MSASRMTNPTPRDPNTFVNRFSASAIYGGGAKLDVHKLRLLDLAIILEHRLDKYFCKRHYKASLIKVAWIHPLANIPAAAFIIFAFFELIKITNKIPTVASRAGVNEVTIAVYHNRGNMMLCNSTTFPRKVLEYYFRMAQRVRTSLRTSSTRCFCVTIAPRSTPSRTTLSVGLKTTIVKESRKVGTFLSILCVNGNIHVFSQQKSILDEEARRQTPSTSNPRSGYRACKYFNTGVINKTKSLGDSGSPAVLLHRVEKVTVRVVTK